MKRETITAWVLLAPALFFLIVFTYYPAIASFAHSFYSNETAILKSEFVALDNYKSLLSDAVFKKALTNTFYFALLTVVPSIVLAYVMAKLVNEKILARSVVRLSFFTPTILPMIAVANIWLFFYAPQIGLFDRFFADFGISNVLGNESTVMLALSVMTVWKEAGFFMIFYLAALQNVPSELKEACAVEGGSHWYFMRKIEFSLLMPTTFFILINALLNSFKLVDHLFVLTKGGPDNASSLLLYYIYEVAFSYFDYSYAATLTVVMLLILLVISLIQFGVIEKRIHYR